MIDDDQPTLAEIAKTPLYDLAELLANPELLRTPPVIIPRLAFEGRLTMLAAAEKAGKSTLLGQAVAANVQGLQFLGEASAKCPVLWLALDEPQNDLVRRLARHGLMGGVSIYSERPSLGELEAAIIACDAGLVVVDTLLEFAAGLVDDPNSAMQWQPVLKSLRGIAQRTGAAFVLIHHMNRSTRTYRDSSQIGAGVDQIVEMVEVDRDPALRKFRVRGRIHSEIFMARYIGDRYELEGAEVPLDLKVYRAIESNPGISLNRLRKAVGGKGTTVDEMIRELLNRGTIENRGDDGVHAYYTKRASIAAGPEIAVSHEGRGGSHAGHGAEHAHAPKACFGLGPDTEQDIVGLDLINAGGPAGSRSGHASGHTAVSRSPIKGERGHT
jgi:hypothetical protein